MCIIIDAVSAAVAIPIIVLDIVAAASVAVPIIVLMIVTAASFSASSWVTSLSGLHARTLFAALGEGCASPCTAEEQETRGR